MSRPLIIGLAALFVAAGSTASAIPPPAPPRNLPAEASPTPAPRGASLPFGSPLYFVLDGRVSSASTAAGTTIPMHLKSPLVVNGVTLAPAGAPASLVVVSTHKAASGDVDGAVQIHLNPFDLPALHRSLPIRAVHEYLTIELTAGQESTRGISDTIGDIFIPGHVLYHAFRPGRQLVLPAGSILRAQTAATIDARNPRNVVFATPQPFIDTYDVPHSDLTPAPFYTAPPTAPGHPRGRPTLPPTPSPTPTPTPIPTPTQATSAVVSPTPSAGTPTP